MKQKVGIVGFRGYSGAELVRLLARHEFVTPILLEHRQDAEHRAEPIGHAGPPRVASTPEAIAEAGIVCVFLATPPEVSMELSGPLLERGIKVVDLSGAFRLKTVENYAHWYKEDHKAGALLAEAVYGLPEFYRPSITPTVRLISNPGCYPTAANLAIAPLVVGRVLPI